MSLTSPDPGAVSLRTTQPGDIDFVVEAEADPANQPWLTVWPRQTHLSALADPDLCHLVARDAAGVRVGYVILGGLENRHGSVQCRRIVIARRGRGLGQAALRGVVAFVFEDVGAHRLWLDVDSRNDRARHVYARVGFVDEGVLRESIYRDGDWRSMVVMSMLETEYREAQRWQR